MSQFCRKILKICKEILVQNSFGSAAKIFVGVYLKNGAFEEFRNSWLKMV